MDNNKTFRTVDNPAVCNCTGCGACSIVCPRDSICMVDDLEGFYTPSIDYNRSLANVSVYNVYFMVVNGIKAVLISATTGIQSVFGEYLATGENEKFSMNRA